ncbi:GspE/PulE family protein [Pelagicoccus sp. SDUM812003]|uniref:GspE/PulE family protein n=1 Tax=Pelagicoccus sp. SDUM812003 TaxID=3041267 RepID=UPI00280D8B28|nr:GspE/PulE family protein [Pelagicoccus sp. SDUM812003]MDQ8201937.1 GspE/PulE family protein [Pelagicoccus sp. SDUM812003]
MFNSHNQAVSDLCLIHNLLGEKQLASLKAAAQARGHSLADEILQSKAVSRSVFLDTVASYLGLERLKEAPYDIPTETVALIEPSLARMHGVVPVDSDERRLVIVSEDPFNTSVVEDVAFSVNRDVVMRVLDPQVVGELLDVYYRPKNVDYTGILEEIDLDELGGEEDLTADDLLSRAGETPIIRFVNLVLAQAIKDKASDIHFEPFEKEFKIRYRIDGALYEMSPPPRELAVPIISRVKVIGALNIAERRVPQDGKVRLVVSGRHVDLRISTLPTQFGESVVLRVLDQSATSLDLMTLGMPDDVREAVELSIARPNGIFISTGPTGSGKTTTLYSCLKRLNLVESKLMTAEDPIEYEIDGIMQVAVNAHIGLSFSSVLKSFLRQDPDIIMVGEIRDLDTAQISIQASLTGHLVLTTLHTNDASGAVTRLMDMGIEPFLISSSLEAVLAQRLLRRICSDCRRAYLPDAALLQQLNLDPTILQQKEFFQGTGCETCANTGYSGRLGIFEMLRISESVRELISEGKPAVAIREQAIHEGMRTLREDGLRNIFTGVTSVDEVIRYS